VRIPVHFLAAGAGVDAIAVDIVVADIMPRHAGHVLLPGRQGEVVEPVVQRRAVLAAEHELRMLPVVYGRRGAAVGNQVLQHVQPQGMRPGDQLPILLRRADAFHEPVIIQGPIRAAIFDGHDPDGVGAQAGIAGSSCFVAGANPPRS